MEIDVEVLCSVMMQQNMTTCKKEAMTLLKRKALLNTRNYTVKTSAGVRRVRKLLTAIMHTGTGPSLLKRNCLLRAWARQIVTLMATRLRFAVNKQLETNGVIRLDV